MENASPSSVDALLASCEDKRVDAPMQWLDTHLESIVRMLAPPELGLAYGPREVGAERRTQSVRLPAIHLHRFEKAIVSTMSSAVLLQDRLLIERVEGVDPAKCDFRNPYIVEHSTTQARLQISGAVIDVPRGIFLGGNGADNYYHLLVEIIPRLQHLLEDGTLDRYPLLVDASIERIPNLRSLIEIASGGHPFLTLRADRAYRVHDLLYVATPNITTFNLRSDVWFELSYTLTRPSTVAFLRERLGLSDSCEQATRARTGPKRVFLARKPGIRNYNQDEIRGVFEQQGFVSVQMDSLTVPEQVRLMDGADLIAGPSGAAWANLAFAREGAKCLCWTADAYRDFAPFCNLAEAVGADLYYLFYSAGVVSTRVLHKLDYRLDPHEVKTALQKLLRLHDVEVERGPAAHRTPSPARASKTRRHGPARSPKPKSTRRRARR